MEREEAKELLKDTYDLHIHCGPDIIPRKVDDLEMAKRANAAGMKGFAIKSHYTPTAERATVVRHLYPKVHAIGSITLNSSVGGINPMAVETAARLKAGIVWCPTFDFHAQQSYYLKNLPGYVSMQSKLKEKGIKVPAYRLLDADGRLTEDMQNVFDLVQEYDMVLGTGHITHKETFALAQEAAKRKFNKLVITHAEWEFTSYTIEEQRELVKCGAVIEHTYTSPGLGRITFEEIACQIKLIGAEHCILSTDLGQEKNEYPEEGLAEFYRILIEYGVPRSAIRRMSVENTAALVD